MVEWISYSLKLFLDDRQCQGELKEEKGLSAGVGVLPLMK